MLHIAVQMLVGDRAKYAGLLFGIAFTAFLVTFAASYFCGLLTRGFALITENGAAGVWVMDPAVASVEQTTNMPAWALDSVRSVDGVQSAVPLVLGTAEARLPNGQFQPCQVIGVDDATLAGVPTLKNGVRPTVLRAPDAVIVASGGTSGKLETPALEADRWPRSAPHLDAPTRALRAGDTLLVNDHRVWVVGQAAGLPRFPPRPLLYTALPTALRILLPERRRLTFVLATVTPGVVPRDVAARIEAHTGLRARVADDFKADTVWWFLRTSEDVGDLAAMLTVAMAVGFGVTGVLLYMFTSDNLKQYAVLTAMGATAPQLLAMLFAQVGLCGLVGTGLGLGVCGIAGQLATAADYPFRMLWFTPLAGGGMVVLVCVVAAALSVRPVLTLQPVVVFAGR